jgi:Fur family transcriptional regulator, zinc uptake regulator
MPTEHGSRDITKSARRHCEARGLRLTKGRMDVLKILSETPTPISAYDLLDLLRASRQGDRVHPQTVYRALDFLREAGLVHGIASTGKFILCEHVSCDHPHRPSQFLVCRDCGSVKELELSNEQLETFTNHMQSQGFSPLPNGIEVHGVCAVCRSRPKDLTHH